MVLHLKKLESLSSKHACATIDWNWLRGSREEHFLISSMYFHYYIIISPWKRAFIQGYFVQSLVKIGQVVLEKKIFKSCQFIFIIFKLSPLWEGRGPSFDQTWIPFTQGYFVPSLVEIGPVVLEKKIKMWKIYRQTDGQTDDGRQVVRKAHLSFQLRWAKNCIVVAHGLDLISPYFLQVKNSDKINTIHVLSIVKKYKQTSRLHLYFY